MTNKSKADANRDFIWITRGFSPGICPKLFWWVASQGLSFTDWWEVSTSKIIHHILCFSLPCSHPHLLTSLSLLRLCSALLLSPFPVAGNSHNCRPSFPPSQEAAGSGLADSECSAPVGVCQQLANKGCCSPPQRLCYIHGKLEVKSLNTVINRLASLKLADREECLTNNCCELRWLIWNYPIIAGSQSAAFKTTQKAGKRVLIN